MVDLDDDTLEQLADLLARYESAGLGDIDQALIDAALLDESARRRFDAAASALNFLQRVGKAPTGYRFARDEKIGRFQIVRELGNGAFGIVYLAKDPNLNRDVALKVLRSDAEASAQPEARFEQEAHAAASLKHPNIVPVFERGEADGVHYIASAFCAGPTLAEWLSQTSKPVPVRIAASIVAQICSAVQYAHEHGVLHRDLKPANILLEPLEEQQLCTDLVRAFPFRPLLADWGLAKPLRSGKVETCAGATVGTPGYIAPEQGSPDASQFARAGDVYALGVLLYVTLIGEEPLHTPATAPAVRLRRSDLPVELEAVLVKALTSDPSARYQSAAEFAVALQEFLNRQVSKPRVGRLLERVATLQWPAAACVVLAAAYFAAIGSSVGHQPSAVAVVTSSTLLPGIYSFQNIDRESVLSFADNWMSDRTDSNRHHWEVIRRADGVLLKNVHSKFYFTARIEGGSMLTVEPDERSIWEIRPDVGTIKNVAKDMYLVMPRPPNNLTLEKLLGHYGSRWRIKKISTRPI